MEAAVQKRLSGQFTRSIQEERVRAGEGEQLGALRLQRPGGGGGEERQSKEEQEDKRRRSQERKEAWRRSGRRRKKR